MIKDAMREQSVNQLADSWYQLMVLSFVYQLHLI